LAHPSAVTTAARRSWSPFSLLKRLLLDADGAGSGVKAALRARLRTLRSYLPGSRVYKDEMIARMRQQVQSVLFNEFMPVFTEQLTRRLSETVIAPQLRTHHEQVRNAIEQAVGCVLSAQASQWNFIAQHCLPQAALVRPLPNHRTIEECFAELERAAPAAYKIWRELLAINEKVFEGFPVHSCSVATHPMAELFRTFLRRHLWGAVLDIGCGPQPIPLYLDNHPRDFIAGIDPILPPQPHPFTFVQTVAEFLPWADNTFDVIVVGTSLDHVFLLDRALLEMRRVLKPTGRLVIWTAFTPGAPRYDPYRPDARKFDEFHLFHFDRGWFEEMLGQYFVVDEAALNVAGGDSSFYSFRPR
jgi:SAM-dependent methyltransferase